MNNENQTEGVVNLESAISGVNFPFDRLPAQPL
jgi:hypothetical protein